MCFRNIKLLVSRYWGLFLKEEPRQRAAQGVRNQVGATEREEGEWSIRGGGEGWHALYRGNLHPRFL